MRNTDAGAPYGRGNGDTDNSTGSEEDYEL